jgi:hypothetical protein
LLKTKATRICCFEVPNISPDISNLRSIQATALREDIPSARQLEEIASAALFDDVRNLHRLLRLDPLAWAWLGGPSLEHFDMDHVQTIHNTHQNRDIIYKHKWQATSLQQCHSPSFPFTSAPLRAIT